MSPKPCEGRVCVEIACQRVLVGQLGRKDSTLWNLKDTY